MVCDQCNEHNITSALLCKTALLEHLNNELKPYLRCQKCKNYHHKLFMTLSKNHNLHEIIYHYNLKDVKSHLKTTKTKQQVNKHSMGYIRYITHCIKFYKGGRFYDDWMIKYQNKYQEELNNMKAKHHINLKTFFIDFYCELCDKRMNKADALFMEKYITKLLILS